MTIYGRRPIPGEHQNIGAHSNYHGVLNRTIRAQVSTVEPADGFVTLDYDGLPSGGKFATVAPLWMSFPNASIGGPAWGRYMPQKSDLVKLAFDYDDKPHIVGFDIVAGKENVANGIAGWPAINELHTASETDDSKAKFAQFTPLNPGEYDFMSSGAAYIYGNNQGRLYLAGGSVSVSLIKNDLRISSNAQLWSHLADDCDFRLGQVRRANSDGIEVPVDDDSDGKFKEFGVNLNRSVSPGVSLALSELKTGNVVGDDGAVLKTPKADQDARFWFRSFDEDGNESLKMAIDKLGNWDIVSTTTDKGVNFDFANADWTTSFNTVTFNISSEFDVNSPKILLGENASHPLILSNIYRPAEDEWFAKIDSSIKTLASAMTTIGGLLTTAGNVMIVPIGGAIYAATPIASAGATATSAGSTVTSSFSSALSTFTSKNHLSDTVKTK